MRDSRGRSPSPKPIGRLARDFSATVAPQTPLAAIQAIWDEAVGERIAAVTEVVEEREGLVTVECSTAVWAQELELMAPRISARIADRLGGEGPEKLRFRVASTP